MSKCPFCHIDYNSTESFNAHVTNCGFKNNPIEDVPEDTDKKDLTSLKVEELKKLAEEKNLDVEGLKKAEIIEKLLENEETGD